MSLGLGENALSSNTPNRILIDAGVIYINYGIAGERKLGATQGGAMFDMGIKYRDIAVDGARGIVKGLRTLEACIPMISAKLLEISNANLLLAVPGLRSGAVGVNNVTTLLSALDSSDYITNVALVGNMSGSSTPVIFMIKNAIGAGGIKFDTKDKGEGLMEIEFTGTIDPATPTVLPFEIRMPTVIG
jgi:hypothetical protein